MLSSVKVVVSDGSSGAIPFLLPAQHRHWLAAVSSRLSPEQPADDRWLAAGSKDRHFEPGVDRDPGRVALGPRVGHVRPAAVRIADPDETPELSVGSAGARIQLRRRTGRPVSKRCQQGSHLVLVWVRRSLARPAGHLLGEWRQFSPVNAADTSQPLSSRPSSWPLLLSLRRRSDFPSRDGRDGTRHPYPAHQSERFLSGQQSVNPSIQARATCWSDGIQCSGDRQAGQGCGQAKPGAHGQGARHGPAQPKDHHQRGGGDDQGNRPQAGRLGRL